MQPIPTAIHYHGNLPNAKEAFFDEDLRVFVVDSDHIDKSVESFRELYSMRTKKSREFWLVDITPWTFDLTEKNQLIDRLQIAFAKVPLDLDDDLYLFSGKYGN